MEVANKKTARKVLDAIDRVCAYCNYIPEDETGIDPCEGCKVIETADRMWHIIDESDHYLKTFVVGLMFSGETNIHSNIVHAKCADSIKSAYRNCPFCVVRKPADEMELEEMRAKGTPEYYLI